MDDAALSAMARKLGSVIEPFAGQVYFSPECHAEYVALGFDASPREANGVALPDGPAYFTSRGSVMGQVPGEVVAAAFGVFNPEAVIPSVALGWSRTDAVTICSARDRGAIGQLRRLLGDAPDEIDAARPILERMVEPLRPEGRPLFAGLRSLGLPDDALGAAWRLCDMLREFRGDAHISAWTAAGYDATEIGLVSELYWGLPSRSYSRTRAWTVEQFDAATERLCSRGILDESGAGLTERGLAEREAIEVATDGQMRPAITAAGDALEELCTIVGRWSSDVRSGHGYLASGPHDLAAAARRA